jgi:hypothetical protein
MPRDLKKLAKLKLLVTRMEADLGLSEHSHLNRSLVTAVADLNSKRAGCAPTSDLLEHPLLQEFSRPSIFRALKAMEVSGEIKKVGPVRGYYAPAQ